MKLVPATLEHLQALQGWFRDVESAQQWGGPGLRYPFEEGAFLEDIRWERMPSWSLVGPAGVLVGFGQYYENHGRCHLARLAVTPQLRSRGFGNRLVRELMRVGLSDLSLDECSLFVLKDNEPAIRCYRALGFELREFPEWQEPFAEIQFMVRPP